MDAFFITKGTPLLMRSVDPRDGNDWEQVGQVVDISGTITDPQTGEDVPVVAIPEAEM